MVVTAIINVTIITILKSAIKGEGFGIPWRSRQVRQDAMVLNFTK